MENPITPHKDIDPTLNVKESINQEVSRIDDLRKAEVKRIDDNIDNLEEKSGTISLKDYFDLKITLTDTKVQSQFTSAKEAVAIASTAQEKAMVAAQVGTKEALDKADTNNDKRFDAISQKIDTVTETISRNTGAQGIYVTHSDLSIEMEKLRISFESMLTPVKTFMDNQQGQQKGISGSWGVLLGGVGFISTIIGIFMIMSRFLP